MNRKRILAFILAVSMAAGDTFPAFASSLTESGEWPDTYEEDSSSEENLLNGSSQDVSAYIEEDGADISTDTEEDDQIPAEDSEEENLDASENADEISSEDADVEEDMEIEPIYGESEILTSYLSEETPDEYGISLLSEQEWTGAFGDQISDHSVAKELYDFMVQSYVTEASGEETISGVLEEPITFEASITSSESEDGTTKNTLNQDENYQAAVDRLTEGFYMAFPAFIRDYPEVFWIAGMGISYTVSASGNASVGYTGTISEFSLKISQYYDEKTPRIAEYQEAVSAVKVELEQEIGTDASRYDIVKKIHDYLCETLEYNSAAVSNTGSYLYAHTSSTVFLGQSSDGSREVVCEGYAKAMKVLCDQWEIPCVLVSGTGVTQSGSEAHMWNYVQMEDGKWYAVDATWDDQTSGIRYNYFLAGSESKGFYKIFGEDHVPEALTAGTDASGIIFSFVYPVLELSAYDPSERYISGIRLLDENGSELNELSLEVGQINNITLQLLRADGSALSLNDEKNQNFQIQTAVSPAGGTAAGGWYDGEIDPAGIFVEGISAGEEAASFVITVSGFDGLTEKNYEVIREIPLTVSAGTRDYPDYRETDIKVFEQGDPEGSAVSRTKLLGSFDSLDSAKAAVLKDAEGKTDPSYEILVFTDQSAGASDLEFGGVDVDLKLNGHVLTASETTLKVDINIDGGGGSIDMRSKTCALWLGREDDEDLRMELLDVSFLNVGSATVNIYGNVTLGTDLKVLNLNLYGKLDVSSVTVTGTMTAVTGASLGIRNNSSVKLLTVSGTEPSETMDIILESETGVTETAPVLTISSTVTRKGTMQAPFLFHKYVDGEEVRFEDGEKLAVISLAESKVPTGWFQAADSGQCIVRTGTSLTAETVNLAVTCETTGQTVRYKSLEQAISRLAADFGSTKGTYAFVFSGDEAVGKNLTFPSIVQNLVLSGAESAAGQTALDLYGHTLTFAGKMTLEDSLLLCSTASARGKLNLTGTASASDETDHVFSMTVSGGSKTLVKNVDITASKGRIGLAGENADGAVYRLDSVVSAKYVVAVSGSWKLEKLNPVTSFENKSGAVVEADTYAQTSSGKTYLDPGSTLVIGTTAAIYNIVLEDGEDCARLFRKANASVTIYGTIVRGSGAAVLSFGLVDENGAPTGAAARTVLFATNQSSFPAAAVSVYQPEGADTEKYTAVYQQNKEIRVGREWITVKTQGPDGKTETEIGSFTRWADVQTYLNTIYNTSMTYIIELDEDVLTEESLTLPTRVGGIIFRGAVSEEEPDKRIVLSYVGNLSLAAETTFENIELRGSASAAKTYDNGYYGALALNGKNLTFINSAASFTTITGKSTNVLTLTDSKISATGAVSGIYTANLTDSVLEAKGAVTVTNTLRMEGSVLDSAGKMSLANVISNSEDNRIAYGGNAAANILTITGTVTSEKLPGDKTVQVDGGTAEIQRGAVDLVVHALEDGGYTQDVKLLNAAKAAASWFVIGSSYAEDGKTRESCAYITHKDGTVIKCGGPASAAVVLKRMSSGSGAYEIEGSFATLQEAFSEIDRAADKTASYQVIIKDDAQETVTKTTGNLTWPLYASCVTVMSENETAPKNIFYKNALTLRCNMVFQNLILAPAAATSTLALGSYQLTMNNCKVAENGRITAVSGSGVAKTSLLELVNTRLTVYGAVSNVGSLKLNGEDTSLTAQGAITLGYLYAETGSEQLTGYAAVTRSKNMITAVTPQITVNSQIYAENGVVIGLTEKVNGAYRFLDFTAAEAENISKTGIRFIKAVNAPADRLKLSAENIGESDAYCLVKTAGYAAYTTKAPDVRLTYELDGEQRETYALTFANAVTEINNLKTKRDYTMTLMEAIEADTLAGPAALTMPSASYISSLKLESGKINADGNREQITLHYLSNISMTTNLELGDIAFVQVVKSGAGYVPVSTAKKEYPSIVTVSTGAYTLDIEGTVSFNSPILLNGGSKGTLVIGENGQIYTKTNHILYLEDHYESLICGKVTNLASLTIESEQCLTVQEYGTLSGAKVSYTAASFTAASVNCSGELNVTGGNAGGNATITNLNLTGGRVEASGNLVLTNVTLTGRAELWADKTFNITGTLTSATENAYFYTRQKGVNQAPYLNITGTVVLQDTDAHRIHVGVYPVVTAADASIPVALSGSPSASGQLLTAKSAAAECFVPWSRNVGHKSAFSPAAEDGYLLKKSGTAVYVYYGDEIKVALCKGDASHMTLAEADFAGMVLNYYISFSEAVTAVNTLKDSSQSYTLMLLADTDNNGAPVAVTMPTYASQIIVSSPAEGKVKKLCYSNTLSLKTPTVFANVELNPMNAKKAGVKLGISTGAYDLTLRGVTVGSVSGMLLGNIAGNAKQTTTLDSAGLTVSGNITGSKEVAVNRAVTVNGNISATTLELRADASVSGTVSAAALQMDGGVKLTGASTVTLTNIINNGPEANTISYGRTARNVTCLTVNGTVSGDNENALILNMTAADKTAGDFALEMTSTGLKTTLSDAKKLANIQKLATSDFIFRINGTDVGEGHSVVKAGKSLYLIPVSMEASAVTLLNGTNGSVTEFLDYAQAVTEINNLAAAAEYTIQINTADLTDTNITDNYIHSSFPLPGKNKAGALTIEPSKKAGTGEDDTEITAEVTFSGAMTAYGDLTLKDLVLRPVKSASSDVPADFNMAAYQSVSKTYASLTLDNVRTAADISWKEASQDPAVTETTGFVGTILGTKSWTNVTVVDSDLRLKTGFSNINDLTLENAGIITCGTSAVNDLTLTGAAHWDALGKTTIANVRNQNASAGAYLAAKQAAKTYAPQVTISGTVESPVLWRVVKAESNNQYLQYVEDYRDVALAITAKETADKFIAYAYGAYDENGSIQIVGDDKVAAGDWISYKDVSNYVRNGSVKDMVVCVTKNGGGPTYAKSFAEAVTSINNAADTTADYVIQFLENEAQTEDGVVIAKTAANNAYGSMTLPTKAASVTIRGVRNEKGEAATVLKYTGTLIPRCNVTFEDIILTEGTVKSNVFTPTYQITPVFGSNNYTLTFASTAKTLENPEETSEDISAAGLVWNYVSASKGTLRVEDNSAYVKSYVTMPTMILAGDAAVHAAGAVKITNLYLEQTGKDGEEAGADGGTGAYLQGEKTMAIGSIYGSGQEKLTLDTYFTSITKATQTSVTQLTISGSITGASVSIAPRMYDLTSRTWHRMTKAEAEALDIQAGRTPSSGQKLAVFTKAATDRASVLYDPEGTGEWSVLPEEYNLYKYEGALYVTTQSMGVVLTGYKEEKEIYRAEFLDWAQAVKEIDRIADTSAAYEMKLLTNAGVSADGSVSPMGTLSMPTKAKEVTVCADEDTAVFFTGTTVTIRCSTTFDRVNLTAVKKVTSAGVTSYTPVSYNISGSNWTLTQLNQAAAVTAGNTAYAVTVGTVSGGGKGSYIYTVEDHEDGSDAENMTVSRLAPATKISGYGTVQITGGHTASALTVSGGISGVAELVLNTAELQLGSADLSVTNLELHDSVISGRNLTVTGMTTLNGGTMTAGTDTIGTGTLKLTNITVQSSGNLLQAKQNKSGVSLLTVGGTVTAEPGDEEELEPIRIGIFYNNTMSGYAQLHEGMTLLTATKAEASWFEPYYTSGVLSGMGDKQDGWGLYKSGRTVKYGKTEGMEVRLSRVDTEGEAVESSLFATFEEAVTEINYIALYKTGTKVYEDYTIELLKDVEIGNASGNGVYSALTLPTKAGSVRIFSSAENEPAGLYFAGTLTVRCSTFFENIGLYPMSKGAFTTANYSIGNYTLELNGVDTTDGAGGTLIGTVSGSSASGTLKLGDGQRISAKTLSGLKEVSLGSDAGLTITGNCSAYQLRFMAEKDSTAALQAGGTLTTTLIYLTGEGNAVIQKPLTTAFTVNGASLDLNGDKIKENVAVIRESAAETEADTEDLRKVEVQILADVVPAGTKVLTCKYLTLDDYKVTDQDGRGYDTYQSGTALMVGTIQAERTIQIGGRTMKYSLPEDTFTYNGGEIRPALALKNENDQMMTEGTDYQLNYQNNVNAGTATMTVTLMGNIDSDDDGEAGNSDSADIAFTIQRKNLSSRTVDISFTGILLEDGSPEITVQDSGRMDGGATEAVTVTLTEGTDYMLYYEKDGGGTVVATVYGANGSNYRGKASLEFKQLASQSLTSISACRIEDYQREGAENNLGIVVTETGTMQLQLTADNDLADYQKALYIVELDNQGKTFLGIVGKAELCEEGGNVYASTLDYGGDLLRSGMMSRYALAVIGKKGYYIASDALLITNPYDTAVTTEAYPSFYTGGLKSKKGIQTQKIDEANELGCNTVLLNIPLNEIIRTTANVKKYGAAAYSPYEYRGKTYYFFNMNQYMDTIYDMNWNYKYQVTVNLLMGWDSELTYLIYPSARQAGHSYYALNMTDSTARETLEAMFSYIAYKLGGSRAKTASLAFTNSQKDPGQQLGIGK